MVLDPDTIIKERTDRIEKTVEELRQEMLDNRKQLRSEFAAVEQRLTNEICVADDSIKKLREVIVGNGSTGLSQRIATIEVLVGHNADAVKDLKDSIRYYFRWFLATGVLAVVSMATSGIIEVIKMWANVHKQ